MKTFKFFAASLFLLSMIVSCSKDQNDKRLGMSGAVPLVEGTIAVPGANNGGNVTCEEVSIVTGCEFDFSSGRLDYGTWKNGGKSGPISWTNDGTYVTWSSTVPVKIAIIVKGGPNANVYFSDCEDCLTGGSGLSAPINPNNGKPYGLSNITFCYSLCDDLVVGFKSYMQKDKSTWVTTGSFITSYPLVLGASYKLYQECWVDLDLSSSKEVGNLTITDTNSDDYWEITVDNSKKTDLKFSLPYLYVGTAAGFNENFTAYPYPNPRNLIDPPVNTWTFVLPFKLP